MENNKNEIRTLGFYQPFGTLMLHGKIETRWVRKGKKPPFPLGRYLLYTTQKKCAQHELFNWCEPELMYLIQETVKDDNSINKNGYALCYANLKKVELMTEKDEKKSFVKYRGVKKRKDKNGIEHEYVQWCLYFEDIEKIEPFVFSGKQGVGFFRKSYLEWLHDVTILGYDKNITLSNFEVGSIDDCYNRNLSPKETWQTLLN